MELLEQQPELLAQFAAGALEAFEVLFRQFQSEVYSWIVRIIRDPHAAEDLTVETFWRIYRAHARFDPGRSFGAWARKIATNVALDYLKSSRGREVQYGQNLQAEAVPDKTTRNPAIQRELRERTQLAFQQLPVKLRVVATLALVEEQPHGEIAEALNISTAAVKSRLFRAIALLRRKLGTLDINHE
ncbi:MAG TPA: RNA polymerase sigma factor [Candidatus Sulfotelmatobacter sp.]|jgi:RNA polymerase sigma-70 factor (ECF subfamily)|nr:RNA polymerase sigma factor [Candidatus Sulfotelmatobacter sp.]